MRAPVYSHLTYDVMPNHWIEIDRPDILIVEGLNVLQTGRLPKDGKAIPFVSDFFDFSVYLDADEDVLRDWYVDRFLALRETAFRDPKSYFHRYSTLSDEEASEDRIVDLEADQPRQSAREYPADAPARRSHPQERRKPRRRGSRAAAAVSYAARCVDPRGEVLDVALVERRDRQDDQNVGGAELVVDHRAVANVAAEPQIALDQRRQARAMQPWDRPLLCDSRSIST